ncbi:glycosyltransferase family 4 protein [Paenibacillus sp. UMB4589-SE434]|uniref:glycosyltransferase family 4 protein n=1 Tax=Paenibacillus sp. UMB4589-SE434 TaxID=3046314 RepID=UPI00254CC285|nr:glycosyltransferase family 4 protein [Paenibacillus sp. UMB4589-SE434]MDK8183661.1 glycosyltransferase family 4 protein [Paenibacillus sp. UMB4589-SE434]
MKPTIVCFSHLCNTSYITGAEKLLLFLLRELSPRYNCVLIVPQEGILAREAWEAGIAYRVQPCPLFYSMVHPTPSMDAELEELRHQAEYGALVRLLQDIQPDYVLTNTSVHVVPALAAKSLGIPILWQITEVITDNEFTSKAAAIVHSYADMVIGISHTTLYPLPHSALPQGPFPPHYVLPPSWHMAALEPLTWLHHRCEQRTTLGLSDREVLIGYISSSINWNKGLEHFVEMALRLCAIDERVRFVILGDPVDEGYMEHCLRKIHESSYAGRFQHIRFEPIVQRIYPAMDIVVIPSLIPEGFGMTALEGLIFGKPVVVYRSGGLAEIAEATGNAAFAAEPGSVAHITDIVTGLLHNPAEMKRVGESNALAVQQVYGIEQCRARLHHLFVQLIMAQPSLFYAIQGSSHDVFIRDGMIYRRAISPSQLRSLGVSVVRRVTDEVLHDLPKGDPLPKQRKVRRRLKRYLRGRLRKKRRLSRKTTLRVKRRKRGTKQRMRVRKGRRRLRIRR